MVPTPEASSALLLKEKGKTRGAYSLTGLSQSACGWTPCAKVWGGLREAGSDSPLIHPSDFCRSCQPC